jgi:hypothetical protein
MSQTDAVLADLWTQRAHFVFPVLAESEVRQSVTKLSLLAEKMSQREPRYQTRTGLEPEVVWAKWEQDKFASGSLGRREWQTLCGSPLTALRPQLIAELRGRPEPLARLANLIGIASAYFRYWRPEEAQFASAATVEKLILRELEITFRTSKNRVIQTWKKFPQLFGPRASEWMAETSLRDRRAVSEVAKSMFIESAALLVNRSLHTAATKATIDLVKSTVSTSEDWVVSQLGWIKEKLLVDELSPDTYRKCMADLIVSPLPDRYPSLRQSIVQMITADTRLGDPRLAENGANWRFLPNEPREIFLSWLAQQYIQLFFNLVVPKSDQNRRRAEFWLLFAKRKGNIKDFQVAVSPDDLWKVDLSPEAKGFSYARVSTASNASSAFLMEFHALGERYIVVDFSETGYAACIYTKAVFEANKVSLRHRSFNMTELRNTRTRSDSINHQGAWETTAGTKLRRLGIVP